MTSEKFIEYKTTVGWIFGKGVSEQEKVAFYERTINAQLTQIEKLESENQQLKQEILKNEATPLTLPFAELLEENCVLEAKTKQLGKDNTDLFNDYESRIYAVTQVLKDICHHVDKDCFATCKGDYSGTSCLTYRIWDALFPTALIIANQTRLNGGHNSLESSILQPLSEENADLKVRLVKVQELIEKWQHDMPVGSGMPTLSMREIYFRCIHELEALLK